MHSKYSWSKVRPEHYWNWNLAGISPRRFRFANYCKSLADMCNSVQFVRTPSKCESSGRNCVITHRLVLAVRLVPAEVVRGRRLWRSVGTSRTSGKKASSVDDVTRRGGRYRSKSIKTSLLLRSPNLKSNVSWC